MKKITLMLVAMLAAFAANAWTVKFTNPDNWTDVKCHAWNGSGDLTGGWPGAAMTEVDGILTYSQEGANPTGIIFNGSGGQTGNLEFVDNGTYSTKGLVGDENEFAGWYAKCGSSANGFDYYTGTVVPKNGIVNFENVKLGTGEFSFGIWNGSKDLYYGGPETITVGVATELKEVTKETGRMKVEGATAESVYNITFDVANLTVTVAAVNGSVEEDVITYSIYGNILSTDSGWSDHAMTDNDGIWSYTADFKAGAIFGLRQLTNGKQTKWYSYKENATIAEGSDCHSEGNDQNIGITEAGKYTVTFDPTTSIITVKKDSSTSVSTIEASNSEAVYFNMQGVRVANPENGLFIRVQNGKAVKVVK